jgi:superfamily I DNA/RNA helicase
MRATDEQAAALDLFLLGENMVIDALAGTGKTSTLRLLAASTRRRGRYVAFNRALVDDAAGTFSSRCAVSTIHSLAMRQVGTEYAHRLNSPRMKSYEVATRLGIDPLVVRVDGKEKRLAAGFLAGHVMRAVRAFCQSADPEPTRQHFAYLDGIDLPEGQGQRGYANNNAVAAELEGALRKAWQDLSHTEGQLQYGHHCYLKLWGLSAPRIDADYVLLDEAQDVSPVMAAIIEAQKHAQRVMVGDAQQAIYGWAGAIDAMANFDAEHRRALTLSFRFGEAVADAANQVLDLLGADLRVRGNPAKTSTVGELDDDSPVDALLCRTNASALTEVMAAQAAGLKVYLVGGGKQVAAFARAAHDLKAGHGTSLPDLACFDNWLEVLRYCEEDPEGSDFASMVRLVEQFGVESILRAVDGAAPEAPGTLTVSTCHVSKGREWDVVRIAEDMVGRESSDEELRLRYVAFTRAREHLDESVFRTGAERGGNG